MSNPSQMWVPGFSMIPKEEMLEIPSKAQSLFIGIPKESWLQEKRVALTPEAVRLLVNNGHRIRIETEAGQGARYSDMDFSEAGAEIVYDTKEVYEADVIVKVEPPSLSEIDFFKPKQLLISALQLKTRKREYFKKLMDKKITALAYEHIKDEDGIVPIVRSMSEIAGTTSILIASEYLSNMREGKGYLLGGISGVPPTEVLIIGAGTVGIFAAKTALALGAMVKVFDKSIMRLRRLQETLNQPVYTSILQPNILSKALKRADVAIGALRPEKGRTPTVVTEDMVEKMKPGSVIVDVSIDNGGVFETSEITTHDNPVFIKHGVIHYCVPNIASRVSRTASFSLSNVLAPLLLDISEKGGYLSALKANPNLRSGLYLFNGIVTNKAIGEWYNLPYSDAELLIGF
ncbi:alanine dehydrogenase [Thermaurantimonas aggregans]|uniref:alanine dehydrogenase n=1 Tax=Thermaurantimonas aggregans TaxID=2173829 RepID=A0A401XJ07_9FLAO|nr:alanine dehydrogenase [Thermaurantimonas aggregans]MCX8148994.1 alanine dehydrogenase [Thermaurantimonas aggregans]GCD76990.1 alanine dehydrogenase [Thermaurantimonas aggregans]